MANRDEMTEATDAQATVPGSAAEALKKHEAAKMSRRAVLSKVGLQFGAAALLALSVDDLARKVTQTIAARNKDSEVAQAVAREFKSAGIAFAEDTNASLADACIVYLGACVGKGCLKDMPVCGCSCKAGPLCAECCARCPTGVGSASPRASCEASCAGAL